MVYDWEYPAPRPDEKENLEMLLDDVENHRIGYEGTTEQDLLIATDSLIKKMENISLGEIKNYFYLLEDYYLGKIISTRGEEQLLYYRKEEMVQEELEYITKKNISIMDVILKLTNKKKFLV